MLNHLKNFAAYGAMMTVLVLGYVAASPDAHAGTSCNRNDVRIDGRDGDNSFSFPARLDFGEEGNIGLSESDCTTDRFQEAKRDARRSAGVAAAMDAFAAQEGLNLTLGYANIGLEDDVNAAAAIATYKHHFADPGVIHGITGKVGFGTDTTGDEMGASVGLTLSFGTF
ncbi:MAG: hypothetical protein ACR2RF_32190 [Geminicoccaceae bacterium]